MAICREFLFYVLVDPDILPYANHFKRKVVFTCVNDFLHPHLNNGHRGSYKELCALLEHLYPVAKP